jgi:hypothetical protein
MRFAPAAGQRRVLLVDHRVQNFKSLVDGQAWVLAPAHHFEAGVAVSVDAVATAWLCRRHLHNKNVSERGKENVER